MEVLRDINTKTMTSATETSGHTGNHGKIKKILSQIKKSSGIYWGKNRLT